jgi:hypothetical protein
MTAGSPRAHVRSGPVAHSSDDFVTEPSHHPQSLVPWEPKRLIRPGHHRKSWCVHRVATSREPIPGRPARRHGRRVPRTVVAWGAVTWRRRARARPRTLLSHRRPGRAGRCCRTTCERIAGALGDRFGPRCPWRRAPWRRRPRSRGPTIDAGAVEVPPGTPWSGATGPCPTAFRFRVAGRHLGGVRRCPDDDLSSGSNAPISTW